MRILQVSTFFNEHGGVEKSVSDLAHALAEQHDVQVLCTGRGGTTRRSIGKVEVTVSGGMMSLSGRPLSLSFGKELKTYDVDVVHFHLPCPIAVFSASRPRAKVKTVTWHHDLVRHKLFNGLMRPLLRRFLRSVDSIIVTAPQLIDHTPLLREFRNKCQVIPLGIDHNRFSSIDHDDVLDQRARYGAPLLLHVGRLVYYKGSQVLLEAMRRVPHANLVIVGTGPLKPQLERLINEFGLRSRVHLVGWQSESVLRSLYQACDVFILPSTLPTECFGLVQVEAMLSGKPIINTALPTGVPWVSCHGTTGLTVTPSNPEELASAITDLLDNSDVRKQYGQNAQQRALQLFTLKRQTELTVQHYEQLLASSNRKSTASVFS